jgi:hypothetical protein
VRISDLVILKLGLWLLILLAILAIDLFCLLMFMPSGHFLTDSVIGTGAGERIVFLYGCHIYIRKGVSFLLLHEFLYVLLYHNVSMMHVLSTLLLNVLPRLLLNVLDVLMFRI